MCWYCGEAVLDKEPIGRSLRCETCGKDLRCCKNCAFYQAGSHNDCAEIRAEEVADKETANFCDWFRLNPQFRAKSDGSKAKNKADNARKAFEALFS
jgi:hypothetical protein